MPGTVLDIGDVTCSGSKDVAHTGHRSNGGDSLKLCCAGFIVGAQPNTQSQGAYILVGETKM